MLFNWHVSMLFSIRGIYNLEVDRVLIIGLIIKCFSIDLHYKITIRIQFNNYIGVASTTSWSIICEHSIEELKLVYRWGKVFWEFHRLLEGSVGTKQTFVQNLSSRSSIWNHNIIFKIKLLFWILELESSCGELNTTSLFPLWAFSSFIS